jgi:8-oxo-dGTP pyrophosphatase MutT (NUDIX family)
MLRRRVPEPAALSRLDLLAARLAARTPRIIDAPERPRAAVAVVLAPDPDSVLLIRRADRVGDRWSGHLAFPGGRWSSGDADLLETARRETREEVGLELPAAALAGTLDDLAPRTSMLPPILVRPFVFRLTSPRPELVPNPEVAEAWWAPLDLLTAPGVFGPVEFARYGTLVRTMGYHLEAGVLWGMTERILTPLLRELGDLDRRIRQA